MIADTTLLFSATIVFLYSLLVMRAPLTFLLDNSVPNNVVRRHEYFTLFDGKSFPFEIDRGVIKICLNQRTYSLQSDEKERSEYLQLDN